MPRYTRAELPPGFALCEYPPEFDSDVPHWQAYRQSDPTHASPRYTRRLKAVEWCYLQLGQEAATRPTERA